MKKYSQAPRTLEPQNFMEVSGQLHLRGNRSQYSLCRKLCGPRSLSGFYGDDLSSFNPNILLSIFYSYTLIYFLSL